MNAHGKTITKNDRSTPTFNFPPFSIFFPLESLETISQHCWRYWGIHLASLRRTVQKYHHIVDIKLPEKLVSYIYVSRFLRNNFFRHIYMSAIFYFTNYLNISMDFEIDLNLNKIIFNLFFNSKLYPSLNKLFKHIYEFGNKSKSEQEYFQLVFQLKPISKFTFKLWGFRRFRFHCGWTLFHRKRFRTSAHHISAICWCIYFNLLPSYRKTPEKSKKIALE